MSRKLRRTSCSRCGRTMRTYLPPDQAICHPCRRAARGRGPEERAAKPSPYRSELRFCTVCGQPYETTTPTQKYCSRACRAIRWRSTTKDSASRRGYDAVHRRTRAQWSPIVAAGDAVCCLCGQPIDPADEWHLDHTPDRKSYRGVAHAHCNTSEGATRGNQQRGVVPVRRWTV